MKRPLRVHFLMGMYAWCVAGVEGVLVTINLVVGVVVSSLVLSFVVLIVVQLQVSMKSI